MAEQQNGGFFERLRKIFSTKVVIARDETGKRKVIDHEQSQQLSNLKSLKDRFYRLQTGYKYENFTTQLSYSTIRRELFLDYDAMDNDPIIASALDIYADEATTKNEYGDIVIIGIPILKDVKKSKIVNDLKKGMNIPQELVSKITDKIIINITDGIDIKQIGSAERLRRGG